MRAGTASHKRSIIYISLGCAYAALAMYASNTMLLGAAIACWAAALAGRMERSALRYAVVAAGAGLAMLAVLYQLGAGAGARDRRMHTPDVTTSPVDPYTGDQPGSVPSLDTHGS